jgi:lysozyme
MKLNRKYLLVACCATGVVVIILSFLFNSGKIWFNNPDRSEYPFRGIDVSHHQGNINWELVAKSDVSFAYIKATEANDFKDPLFQNNWDNAHKNNVPVGAYHYYSLACSGAEQAANFISVVPEGVDSLGPAVDLEYVGNSKVRPSKEDFLKELNTYLITVSIKYGKPVVIYTTYEFYKDYLTPEYEDYYIWIRDISSKPIGFRSLVIWQYNPVGRVRGVSGFVDLNAMTGESLEILSSESDYSMRVKADQEAESMPIDVLKEEIKKKLKDWESSGDHETAIQLDSYLDVYGVLALEDKEFSDGINSYLLNTYGPCWGVRPGQCRE